MVKQVNFNSADLRDEINESNESIQDECMARAKATMPITSEEALQCAVGAASRIIYATTCVQRFAGYDHVDTNVCEFLKTVDEMLLAAAVDALRASTYLNGGTFADPEEPENDDVSRDCILKRLDAIDDALVKALKLLLDCFEGNNDDMRMYYDPVLKVDHSLSNLIRDIKNGDVPSTERSE